MNDPCQSPGSTHYMGCPCWELKRNTALEQAQHRIEALELALEDHCAQPGVAKCAREWEADKQRAALEAVGLAEEFPFGCDAIEHVVEALVACRAEVARLTRITDRRDRRIDRYRLQETGCPVTLDWLASVERLYPDATITQRVCSALRRAWDERDRLKAALDRGIDLADKCEKASPGLQRLTGPSVAEAFRAALAPEAP